MFEGSWVQTARVLLTVGIFGLFSACIRCTDVIVWTTTMYQRFKAVCSVVS